MKAVNLFLYQVFMS